MKVIKPFLFCSLVLFVVQQYSCTTPLFISKKNIDLNVIKVDNKIGYINQKGKISIQPVYDECCLTFNDGKCCTDNFTGKQYGIIKKNGVLGAIDYKGRVIIEPQYDYLEQRDASSFVAGKDNKWGVIDKNNNVVFPIIFDDSYFLSSTDIGVGKIDTSYYLLDFGRKQMTKTEFKITSPFFDGLAQFEKNDKQGYLNKQGKIVIDALFDDAGNFNNGLAPVKVDKKWGFIDTSGKMIIPPRFDNTFGFEFGYNENLAIVTVNGKNGMINRQGEFVFQPMYDDINSEAEGIVKVCVSKSYPEKYGLMNLKGKWLDSTNTNIDYYKGYITTRKRTGYGVQQLKNHKVIVPYIFSSLEFYPEALSKVIYYDKKKHKEFFGYINRKCKVIWAEEEIDLKKLIKENL